MAAVDFPKTDPDDLTYVLAAWSQFNVIICGRQ
jgi:hypothetical protein